MNDLKIKIKYDNYYYFQTPYSTAHFTGRTRFNDDDFFFCCCCCCLRGMYTEVDSQPKLIANGAVLKKT